MSQVIMVGCDLHDRSMLLRFSIGSGDPQQKCFPNDARGRKAMLASLQQLATKSRCERIVLAYEASGLGYGLSDFLNAQGVECYVLSPTHLPKTPKNAKLKTDAKDAQMLLEQVRGFVLAGNRLPVVWTPPQRLRDDRELVRARIDAADESTRVKLKILTLLKRREISKPTWYTSKWSKRFLRWLRESVIANLDLAVAAVLERLVDRYELYHSEQQKLEKAIGALAKTPRYKAGFAKLRKLPGVGLLTAMTFLTEMGDVNRFDNRRQVAAYLGLCPSSHESGGPGVDRKGRITRQGSGRLRKLLCQAVWVSINRSAEVAEAYERIKQGQSKRTKKAVVALMRKLAIRMWHVVMSCGVSSELQGAGGPPQVSRSLVKQRGRPAARSATPHLGDSG